MNGKKKTKEIAIKVSGVSKDFVLPHEKQSSVKQSLINFKGGRTKEVQHALKDISFEVKKGEFFGIVGRNGSGKSTLLKILAEIYRPTKGEVKIKGSLVPFIELGVGFNPELSGRDNIFLNGALLGFSREEMSAMYDDIVEFAELERFMDQKLKNYSSGMHVRLAFSIAIRAESDILLIDEVLAVGDADFQKKCFDYFKSLRKRNKTVVFVSHDMNAIREYCDRAILIDDKKVLSVSTPDKVAAQYTKLFSKHSDLAKSSELDDRWGDRAAIYTSVSLQKRKVSSKTPLVIMFSVEAKQDIEDPVYGFILRNDSGNVLYGTNTNIINQVQPAIKRGYKASFIWELPNIFNSGVYQIDPSIVYGGTMRVADWWEGAIKFEISNPHQTPYPVNPDLVFKKIKS